MILFRENYKKTMDCIKPDEKLLKSILEKTASFPQKKKDKSINYKHMFYMASSIAAAFVIAFISVKTFDNKNIRENAITAPVENEETQKNFKLRSVPQKEAFMKSEEEAVYFDYSKDVKNGSVDISGATPASDSLQEINDKPYLVPSDMILNEKTQNKISYIGEGGRYIEVLKTKTESADCPWEYTYSDNKITADFVEENIHTQVIGENITKEEMKAFISSLN